MFRFLSFALAEVYTLSFAVYQLKNGRKKDFFAIMLPVIIAAVLFLQYLT